MPLVSNVLDDFPMLQQKVHGHRFVYLDSSATALKPVVVIDAMHQFYLKEYATVNRGIYKTTRAATGKYNQVRSLARDFIGAAKEEEIIFTKGTTQSLNLLARSFGEAFISPNDEVLISWAEHHANIVPWQQLCNRQGAILKVIPILSDGSIDLNAYKALLTKNTKLVSIAHISNVLGKINPIQEMIQLAHQIGAKVCIDGAQAISRIPVNVQELDADFYVFSAHKMYGPTGIGVLYGKYDLLNAMPPYETGGDMIEEVFFDHTTFQAPPLRFEAGTPPIAEVIGLGAAIDYINSIGMDNISEHEDRLIAFAQEQCQRIPHMKVLGSFENKKGLITFTIPGIHPLDLASYLDMKGIAIRSGHLCAQPILRQFGLQHATRMSFGVYTTEEDIVCLFDAILQCIKIFN
ncbi:MAG: SufS family cysteine desulfurase [Chlamydiales bacterium]|nr:SufS family cysteine desulfurase [Chlamydiales bacterium]